ncbi:type II toxin-antitoxin system RelE/ParE family toxin [Methylobacterium planeticum]|uniref:Type II toxin-antitoxin system RelE/ParE family toxin n=1 Tax=Methylobacterium planeticum TaxID=2615211 RepID=A0A6N6MMR6_9HYPH|nr:type II toxin-antitoxin system RelE/ParE family toxin [Methylobacterium planeticum]KAB1072086.1 type II toxin-antitoxin system RelE/ParE family toxin [Methylobacterium planeticum]
MTSRVRFSPEARDDLLALRRYIAGEAGAAAAAAFTEAIVAYCESFATFPERGRRRDDIRPGLRVIGFRRRATIAFALHGTDVLVLGVLYAGRDIERALRDHDP